MVFAFDPHVVGRVVVEDEELLAKGDGSEELGEGMSGFLRGHSVKKDGESGVGKEGEGHDAVFKVVEVIGRDGEVGVERLVASRSDEELKGYEHGGATHDQVEL